MLQTMYECDLIFFLLAHVEGVQNTLKPLQGDRVDGSELSHALTHTDAIYSFKERENVWWLSVAMGGGMECT